MAPFGRAFADEADRLARAGRVVAESADRVLVDGLSGREAIGLVEKLAADRLDLVELSDEGGAIDPGDLRLDAEHLRVVAAKPPVPEMVEGYLTSVGFAASLDRPPACQRVWVLGLTEALDTVAVRFGPWGDVGEPVPLEPPPEPSRVVRALGHRAPPQDIGRWLIRLHTSDVGEPALAPWRTRSLTQLAEALAQEIDADGTLVFRGPPLTRFAPAGARIVEVGALSALNAVATWVYENPRELENRHGLVAAEIARSSVRGGNLDDLAAVAGQALEGARIAYNFGVLQQSRETLKSLSELRKSVADETAKLAETSRAMATAVAGAVFGNVGLVIARMTLPAEAAFVGAAAVVIALVLALYVASVIFSGAQFLKLQQELRTEWRDKLYRFLPEDDYERMVAAPSRKAERGFWTAAIVGSVLTVGVLVATILIILAA